MIITGQRQTEKVRYRQLKGDRNEKDRSETDKSEMDSYKINRQVRKTCQRQTGRSKRDR